MLLSQREAILKKQAKDAWRVGKAWSHFRMCGLSKLASTLLYTEMSSQWKYETNRLASALCCVSAIAAERKGPLPSCFSR